MDQGKSINLFDTKASLSPGWQLVEKTLVVVRKYFLGFVCISGLALLLTYAVVLVRTNQLNADQKQYTQVVQGQKVKEGLLLTLRARITALKKILDAQVSFAPYIDTTLYLAKPPQLTSFSMGEKNTVQISVEFSNISDAVTIMETIVGLVSANMIANPNLTSLTIDKTGAITMGISYAVILNSTL